MQSSIFEIDFNLLEIVHLTARARQIKRILSLVLPRLLLVHFHVPTINPNCIVTYIQDISNHLNHKID